MNGFGDVLATAFLSPSAPGRVIWGAGPAFLLPSATSNALGSEKFGIGPSVVVLIQPARWTMGFLFNHLWSVSGANDRSDVNQTFVQPFANYNLGNGVSAGVTMDLPFPALSASRHVVTATVRAGTIAESRREMR